MRKNLNPGARQVTNLIINILTARRRQLGMSQRAVADIIGTSQSAISDLERGNAMPGLDVVCAYAEAVGLNIELIQVEPRH